MNAPAVTTKAPRLNSGLPFTAEMEERIIHDLNDTRIPRRGISLSGGDPLHPQTCRTF